MDLMYRRFNEPAVFDVTLEPTPWRHFEVTVTHGKRRTYLSGPGWTSFVNYFDWLKQGDRIRLLLVEEFKCIYVKYPGTDSSEEGE